MFTARPELIGTSGMVASTHWLATASGMAALEAGGNAFDAAVAGGLTLAVVEPHMNGLGGEAPAILYRAGADSVKVVDAQGPAPRAASIDVFRELGLDLIPGTGLLPACVPAAFAGWMLLARLGRLPLRSLMDHAISYAERGYPVATGLAQAIEGMEELFAAEWTDSAALYLVSGRAPRPGTLLRNPALASTLRRLLDEAEARYADRDAQIEAATDAFYRGFVAESIDGYVASSKVADGTGRRDRGLLTGDDLAAYRASFEDPVSFVYADREVHKTAPCGQGPVFLQQLALLDGFELEGMDPGGAEFIHVVTECAKLAFADREAWYGDPAFVDVPIDALLDRSYSAARRALVEEEASLELRPGSVGARRPRLPWALLHREDDVGRSGAPVSTPLVPREPGDTCHLDAVDREGNLVSVTPSGGWLQGSPVIPDLGLSLTTRAQMFWLEEGLPNSLAAGKRPRTTLSPAIASRDGRPYLAFGTPGGDGQDQWPLHFFLRHVHFGASLQEAIEAPAFHTTHFPSSFFPREQRPGELVVEASVPERVRGELAGRGHRVVVAPEWSLSHTTAVARARDARLRAAADPRGMQAYAAGR